MKVNLHSVKYNESLFVGLTGISLSLSDHPHHAS